MEVPGLNLLCWFKYLSSVLPPSLHLQLLDISVQVVYICVVLPFLGNCNQGRGDDFLEVGDARVSGGSGQDRVSSEGRDLSLI